MFTAFLLEKMLTFIGIELYTSGYRTTIGNTWNMKTLNFTHGCVSKILFVD